MNLPSYTYYTYPTIHGPVTLEACAEGLTRVVFGTEECEGDRRPSKVTNRAATQLQEYLAGKRTDFDVPLAPKGSAFQNAVWDRIADIPYGQTQSATAIAEWMGKPGTHRAVGSAVRRCPVAPFIPAQRVALATAGTREAKILAALAALERKIAEA